MPSISSPIAYPPSSSPAPKRKLAPPTGARKVQTIGGFLIDSDDEDGHDAHPVIKKRMLQTSETDSNQSSETKEDISKALETATVNGPARVKSRFGFLVEEEDEQEQHTTSILDEHEITPPNSQDLPEILARSTFLDRLLPSRSEAKTCDGKSINIRQKTKSVLPTFEQMAAAKSTTKPGRAKKSYYGVDIQKLLEEAAETSTSKTESTHTPTVLPSVENPGGRHKRTLMWTEKYRARKFMDLVGDDRINRQVLGWIKGWDPIVFGRARFQKKADDEDDHRKILLLTGPPGLGKTTLAHVCAKQAGYEVMEINASDDRSRDVVKGRIRTAVGTETVRSVGNVSKDGKIQKAARPVCVVVDEVDGVVSGSGGSGEGGFIKALLDLLLVDQKNRSTGSTTSTSKSKKKDDFRLRRPIILICNDVYHPSLRPLRQSNFAEIVHVRPPSLDTVATRMKSVFEREGVACDMDGIRRLCECAWGTNSMLDARSQGTSTAEGDLRGVLVVGEWVATKLKAQSRPEKLTRKWVEKNLMESMSYGGQGARGVGRGGAKEVVSRVFLQGAGFSATSRTVETPVVQDPNVQLHANELAKRAGMERLRAMVDSSGEIDKIVSELWTEYPTQPFNDDNTLSKPDAANEWFHFHDSCSKKVFSGQDWELAPYLSSSVLACHSLFAGPSRKARRAKAKWEEKDEVEEETHPFVGPKADFVAHELEKTNTITLSELHASFSPTLRGSFRNTGQLATDLVPYLVRILTPDIKPVIVRGSGDSAGVASVRREAEKELVKRAVHVMSGVGVTFQKGRIDDGDSNGKFQQTQWVYRMEPPIDDLLHFETSPALNHAAPVRYAVRQVLDQEHVKSIKERENLARQARLQNVEAQAAANGKEKLANLKLFDTVKRDFFGRVIEEKVLQETDANSSRPSPPIKKETEAIKVWVTYHEGFSNAVRKPVTVLEIMRGL